MGTNEEEERNHQLLQEGEALIIKGRVADLEREQQEARKRDEDYKKRQTLYSKRVAWFTGALVLTSLITNVIYLDMSCTARKSAESAKIAADASTEASNTARQALKGSESSFEKTLLQMQAQTRAQEKAAMASRIQAEAAKNSVENAKQSLQASIDASNLEERPWVGISLEGTKGAKMDQDEFSFQGVTVLVRNSGKTPAIKMSGRFDERLHLWNDSIGDYDSEIKVFNEQREADWEKFKREHPQFPPPPRWEEDRNAMESKMERKLFPDGGVIAPDVPQEWTIGTGGHFLERTDRKQPMFLYIFGKITYYDTLGGKQQHTTKFCFVQRRNDFFEVCPAGNWMD